MALLYIGRYPGLDRSIKIILLFLFISTLAAVTIALPRMDFGTAALLPIDQIGSVIPFAFLLALIGWMPSPVDVAVWSSLWTLEKDRTSGIRTSVEAASRDFAIGYIGTGVLAVGFVALGAAGAVLDVEEVRVNLMKGEQNAPSHLARNPFGRVPVLALADGTFLGESLAIVEYLEESCPEPPMIGEDPVEL